MIIKELIEKLAKTRKTKADYERESYIRDYYGLLRQLSDIRRNFDFIEDEPAIEAIIYEENAVVCRLEHLIRMAKKEHITLPVEEFAGKSGIL